MDSKQRVFARLGGQPVDRIPNLNIVMQFAAKRIGVTYAEYVQDHRLLVRGNLEVAADFGLDAVSVISDPMREGGDLGMALDFPPDGVPHPSMGPLIKQPEDLLALKPIPPESGRRMSDRLNAVSLFKQEVGEEYPIIGWVEGAFAQAADLRGFSEFLMDTIIDPGFVTDLLDLCLEQEILFARAQIEAGADIIGVGDAITSVAGPMAYEEFALPYQIRLLTAIKQAGARTKLHICGDTAPFLDLLPAGLCDIIDVDWMVPLSRVAELHGAISSPCGNYDPVTVLLQGTPGEVREAVRSAAGPAGPRGISSAGCEVPRETPPENFVAVHQALMELR